MKYIVDIKGEIEGDYEIIGKYEEKPQGDLISREALKEEIEDLIGYSLSYEAILNAIDNAPTVEQRPQGEWIDEDNGCFNFKKCSVCNEADEWLDGGSQLLSNFCSNCGARMKGGTE